MGEGNGAICYNFFMKSKIVFMGSPEFALPTLETLIEHHRVVGVVTQPDRPSGRGRAIRPSPVKGTALEAGLPLLQPRSLKETEAMDQLRTWSPDLIVVAAFGQILKPDVLNLPEHGCLNVHASLLPRWRGAAPIQAAILHGDRETGVTIMRMDPGLDTGPILSQRSIPIKPADTAGSLSERLASLGAALLVDTLPPYLTGELQPRPQDEEMATYAPMLRKQEGELDFEQPARQLARKVRAFNPWPGTFTFWKGNRLKVHRATAEEAMPTEVPGKTVIHQGQPAFTTGHGLLILEEIQPAGKRVMAGEDFLQGARGWGDASR